MKTVEEVTEILGLSKPALTYHIRAGNIKAQKVGREYRIDEAEIEKLKYHLGKKQEDTSAYVVSVINNKGGVGKTSLAFWIAYNLTKRGYKVLLVDSDPQSNLSEFFFYQTLPMLERVYESKQIEGNTAKTPINNLDIITTTVDLDSITTVKLLAEMIQRESQLRNIFEKNREYLKKKYNFIIIDCPPNLQILTINSMFASNAVLIPQETRLLSVEKLDKVIDVVKKATHLKILGIVPTFYRGGTSESQEALLILKKNFPQLVFKTNYPYRAGLTLKGEVEEINKNGIEREMEEILEKITDEFIERVKTVN